MIDHPIGMDRGRTQHVGIDDKTLENPMLLYQLPLTLEIRSIDVKKSHRTLVMALVFFDASNRNDCILPTVSLQHQLISDIN